MRSARRLEAGVAQGAVLEIGQQIVGEIGEQDVTFLTRKALFAPGLQARPLLSLRNCSIPPRHDHRSRP